MLNFNQPIKMCSRRSCCPTIEFNKEDGYAIIKDDFGGTVKLLFDEMDVLISVIDKFNQRTKL